MSCSCGKPIGHCDPCAGSACRHMWSDELFCDGRTHYNVCLLRGCDERRYFCKHTGGCRLVSSFGIAKVGRPV